jgi:hypothetical protein
MRAPVSPRRRSLRRSRRAVPGYMAATGKCSRRARRGGERLGPRQPHLGQVVERGDTHVLVEMLRSGEDVPPVVAGGEALLHGRLARERRCLLASETRLSPHTPAARTIIPALLVGPTPRRHSPLAAAQSANRAPCVPPEHYDHDQEAGNAPRVARNAPNSPPGATSQSD